MIVEINKGNFGISTEIHMLGYACFRLPLRARATVSSAGAVTHSPCSYLTAQNIHRHSSSSVLLARNIAGCCHLSNVKRAQHHSSSCLLAGSGAVGATIWHALLPSCHFSDRECGVDPPQKSHTGITPSNRLVSTSDSFYKDDNSSSDSRREKLNPFRNIWLNPERSSLGLYGKCCSMNHSKFPAVAALSEGSWNATWDVRPARWLHGSHSAWLLFGVCSCFSSLNPGNNEAVLDQINDGVDAVSSVADEISHGKKVYTDYSVTGIPGDGRCLFRAVAHGACLRRGTVAPNDRLQRELADDLRASVADELLKRREESEWFIEGDFDEYVKQIKQPYVWGGEPELLMASHVLQMPITVYMCERKSNGLIAIAEYGQDYGKENPIRVLYHGFGHYDALQIQAI